jgi:hypothetical protein
MNPVVMSSPKTTSPLSAQTWLQDSVQKYFSQINWQGQESAVEVRVEARVEPLVKPPVEPPPESAAEPLSLDLKVGEFFARLDWQGQKLPSQLESLSESISVKPAPKSAQRPSAEALLDIDLLENVFLPEGKNISDVTIGDFSDFF